MGEILQFPSKNKGTPKSNQVKVNVAEPTGRVSISLDYISKITSTSDGSTLYIYMYGYDKPVAFVEYDSEEELKHEVEILKRYFAEKQK